jgi:hypothetical protein
MKDGAQVWFREIAAGKRAAILEARPGEFSNAQRSRAGDAAAGYRKLESNYRLRREMYQADQLISRMRRLFFLLVQVAYGPKTRWGLGAENPCCATLCAMSLSKTGTKK